MAELGLTRDEIEVLADTKYGDVDGPYETRSQEVFAMLVDVGKVLYELYLEDDKPDLEDPSSFAPDTLAGVPHSFALIEGFRENLEMSFPDGQWNWRPS